MFLLTYFERSLNFLTQTPGQFKIPTKKIFEMSQKRNDDPTQPRLEPTTDKADVVDKVDLWQTRHAAAAAVAASLSSFF